MAAVDEFSQLKRLILGQEQQSLERLQERVERPATRAQDVAEVLAESFDLNNDKAVELARAMRAPVQRCISDSVRDDPDEFADALFPVIGPAIRKAVRDSISALSEKINQALERSFSAQGIRWRIESARTGVPVSELILRDSFIYRVDQAFVIQRDSGLLIAHAAREESSGQDSDAVSAMLTAIQDFVRDSFKTSSDGTDLDTIRLGGDVVWLFHGPNAITAAIIHGQPPREMRDVFEQVTENIHRVHGDEIESFNGSQLPDQKMATEISGLLQPLLESESLKNRQSLNKANNSRGLMYILVLVLCLIGAWFAHEKWQQNKLQTLLDKITATPGLELIAVSSDRPYSVRIFRDPLAPGPSELLDGLSLVREDVDFTFVPFQSLAPEIVLARVRDIFELAPDVDLFLTDQRLQIAGNFAASLRTRLAGFPLGILGIEAVDFSVAGPTDEEILSALRTELGAPASIDFSLQDGLARLSGTAPFEWVQEASESKIETKGVKGLDLSALDIEPESLIQHLRAESEAPEFVSIELAGKTVRVSGNHSELWRRSLAVLVDKLPYVESMDTRGFVPTEREELAVLAEHIDGQNFYFIRNDQFDQESSEVAKRLASDINRLTVIDDLLDDVVVQFSVRASADAAGTPEQHEAVRRLRAQKLRTYLIANGAAAPKVSIIPGQENPADDDSIQWRRAEVRISLEEMQ